MPKGLSQPVVFEECARVGGEKAINASRLKAGLTYEVIMEDTRAEVFKSKEQRLRELQESKVYRQLTLSEESMALTEAELKQIKEDFILYDKDQNGGISRDEMEELVRLRTQERKDIVEAKYNDFLGRVGVTDELIRKADENKRLYIQHLNEAQAKLLKMFDAADSDGNGILSELEFQFAEWWWIKCTLNPETAHLF
jgi:Ca2+-binding EF-hand superfamily protein